MSVAETVVVLAASTVIETAEIVTATAVVDIVVITIATAVVNAAAVKEAEAANAVETIEVSVHAVLADKTAHQNRVINPSGSLTLALSSLKMAPSEPPMQTPLFASSPTSVQENSYRSQSVP